MLLGSAYELGPHTHDPNTVVPLSPPTRNAFAGHGTAAEHGSAETWDENEPSEHGVHTRPEEVVPAAAPRPSPHNVTSRGSVTDTV